MDGRGVRLRVAARPARGVGERERKVRRVALEPKERVE